MDIIFPIGTESRWQDNELRYALRSIEKNLTGYGKVFIVGWCPKWVTNVIHIKKEDRAGKKQFSIYSKVAEAFRHPECSDKAIMWNDDHFLMDKMDVADFRYWFDGTIDQWGQKAIGNYKAALNNTASLTGLNRYYTDIHTPIVYQRAKYLELQGLDWSKEYVIKTAYTMRELGNFEPMVDLKVNRPMPHEQWIGKAKDRKFISIGPYGVCNGLTQLLRDHFPNPSKFEL